MTVHQKDTWRPIALLFFIVALAATPASAAGTQFSGRATGVQVTTPLLGTVILADTGPLAPEGGQLETTLLSGAVPGVLTAEVFHSSTIGQGDRSRSETSLANLSVNVGNNTIGASFLSAHAVAICDGNGNSSVSGNSEIANLTINGQQITVTGQPNQTIALPGGGQIIINEQSGTTREMTVNALHITVPGVADVIVASAHADVTCAPLEPCDSSKDFVTGGGWIPMGTDNKAKGTFAVAGGIKNGALWGHLTYIDHTTGMKVKGTGVTLYLIPNGNDNWRHIEGTCDIDGLPGSYKIDVADNGEPGHGTDVFNMTLSNGYTVASTLGGGNIQLHNPCRK